MTVERISFAFPSIVTGAVKIICSRKSITALKSQAFMLLKEVIVVTLGDSTGHIAELVKQIKEEKRAALINSIRNIGSNEDAEVKMKEEASANKFTVTLNKDWLTNTASNLNVYLEVILNHMNLLDFNHVTLCDAVIDFSTSTLRHCRDSLSSSATSLLKLFFAPYFMGSRPTVSFADFSKCLGEVRPNASVQEELAKALLDVNRVTREVDSQKQRAILCNCIGFSWTVAKLQLTPILTEDNLMAIHGSLYKLLEFNKTLVEEVLEPLPSSIPLPLPQRISFLTKSTHGSLMKLIGSFSANAQLYEDFCLLLSTLPESVRTALINYGMARVEFESSPSSESEAQRVAKELIILKALSKGLKESQYKLFATVMKYAGGKVPQHASKGDFHFIQCLCLGDVTCDGSLLKNLRVQDQNKLMLQLFEFLASSCQSVKLAAELAYCLLCENLGSDIVEDRYHALIDLLLQKIKYSHIDSRTESALSIISSLIEITPKLFARSLSSVLESLVRCFDKYYQDEFMWVIENYIPIFLKVLKYADSQEAGIVSTNLVRQVLLRAKSLLGSSKNSLVVKAISLLRQSLRILSKRPMEREEAQNFSTEDPDNVAIPDSLTATFYEFWPSVLYHFLNVNNLPAINECLKICGDVGRNSAEFFVTADRFSLQLWPRIKAILGKHASNQLLLTKTQISALKFLQVISGKIIDNESTCMDIISQVLSMLMLREEDKDVVITAYQERLVQLKNESVALIHKLLKNDNEKIKAMCKERLISNCKTYASAVTIWMLCSTFMAEVADLLAA